MTQQRINSSHLPKHCIRAPKGFVPYRIKLQRERKALREREAKEKAFLDDCADWQSYLEQTDSDYN